MLDRENQTDWKILELVTELIRYGFDRIILEPRCRNINIIVSGYP